MHWIASPETDVTSERLVHRHGVAVEPVNQPETPSTKMADVSPLADHADSAVRAPYA